MSGVSTRGSALIWPAAAWTGEESPGAGWREAYAGGVPTHVTRRPNRSPVHVLLVDDYADALEVWELFLSAAGFSVSTATDGVAGLAKARQTRPDVIVMDLQMPGLSGGEVAQALRADAATRHIPLIAATGHSRTSPADARAAGFDSLIVKPCDPDDLVAEIRRLAAAARA